MLFKIALTSREGKRGSAARKASMRFRDHLLRRRGLIVTAAGLVASAVLLGACAYRGAIDDPIQRRFQWFSYLDGSDIRAGCARGAIDRYRLVYNARYAEQVRSYEIVGDGAGGAYLTARSRGAYANLAHISSEDPLAPWRWYKSEIRLSPAELAAFKGALAADGLFEPPKSVGRRFSSEQFYWLASGCVDGAFHFGAWADPWTDLAQLHFPRFLFERDRTGLAISRPHPLAGGERIGPPGIPGEAGADAPFTITIERDGIGGGQLF
jgi:hypothetical protein